MTSRKYLPIVSQPFKTIFPAESSDTICRFAWFCFENLGPLSQQWLIYRHKRSLLHHLAYDLNLQEVFIAKLLDNHSTFEVDKPPVPVH